MRGFKKIQKELNKIKKKIINNKGFTLAEVIASVTIIGILATAAIYSSVNTLNKAHTDYCNQISDNMTVAARDYFNDFKNVLPNDYGIKSCVNLARLESDDYIEELKDYEDNTCNTSSSKVCVLKETNDTFYYSPILDCNKCKTENVVYQDRTEKPIIEFDPDTSQNLTNKDLDVTIKFKSDHKKIISYSYQVYKKGSNGDVIVKGSTDYKKYKNKDVKIELNQRGTFYIKATAINEDGTKNEKTSKDFTLNYTLDCSTKKVITVSASGSSSYSWQPNVWNNKTLKITFTKQSGAIDNYDAIIYKYDCTGKSTCNIPSVNLKKANLLSYGFTVHKRIEHATKNKTITVGKVTDNAIYIVKVVGYDAEGGYCSSDKGQIDMPIYMQDNTAPSCKNYGYKTSPGSGGKWTNEYTIIKADCADTGGSGCKNSEISRKFDISYGDVDALLSPGTVTDNAHNSTTCDKKVRVRDDYTKPTCPSSSGGNTNKRWVKTGSFMTTIYCEDPTVNSASSGCKNSTYNKSISSEGKTETVTATFTDNAGNPVTCSKTFDKYIDKTPPKCTGITREASKWKNSGSVTIGEGCNDPKGDSDPTGQSGCKKDEYTYKTDSEGEYEKHQFTVKDEAGNETECEERKYAKLLDFNSPSVPTDATPSSGCACADGKWFKNPYTMEFSSTDPLKGDTKGASGVSYYKVNGTKTTSGYKVTKAGYNTIKVAACDAADNCSKEVTMQTYYDKNKPTFDNGGFSFVNITGSQTGTHAYILLSYHDDYSGLCSATFYGKDQKKVNDKNGPLIFNGVTDWGGNTSEDPGTGCEYIDDWYYSCESKKCTCSDTDEKTGKCIEHYCTQKCTRRRYYYCYYYWRVTNYQDNACNKASTITGSDDDEITYKTNTWTDSWYE